jgi:hypothetical protein
VTVGPVALLDIVEVSERDVDGVDVTIIDVAESPRLVKVLLGGDPLFSNVCAALVMVARLCWNC